MTFMARPLARSPFVLLALGVWILACPGSWAEDDDLSALNQQVEQLIKQEKYQEAISIAERAVEAAKRTRGPEQPETADALNTLGFILYNIRDYAKAEPLFEEALRIRQKVLGPEHNETVDSLNTLAALYYTMRNYAKAEPLLKEALRIRQKVLGSEHPNTVIIFDELAELYLAALSRRPTAAEQAVLGKLRAEAPDRKAFYEDLLWSLLNSKHFLFVR